jgi:hypothetical protein
MASQIGPYALRMFDTAPPTKKAFVSDTFTRGWRSWYFNQVLNVDSAAP